MSVLLEPQARGSGAVPSPLPRADQEGTGGKSLLLPGDHERLQAVERSRSFAIPVGTHWVERDVLYISEEIARRWPNLAVVSCSCNRCLEIGHYPHMVVESCRDGQTRPVFGFVKFGRHIIDQIQQAHVPTHGREILERIRRSNDQVRRRKHAEFRERTGEATDMLASALSSRKLDWSAKVGDRKVRTDTSKAGRVI